MSDLASSDGFAEDIWIIPVVISELKLRDVQWQILCADLVESTDNAALEDRPEAFDRVGVDRAHDILASSVSDNVVWRFPYGVPRCKERK